MRTVGVFDVGGVLYEFAGRRLLEEHSALPGELKDSRLAEWASLPFVRAFETGHGTVEAFAESVVQYYRLRVDAAAFVAAFQRAAVGFYPGAIRLVTASRFDHKITLSNTNPLQWPRVLSDLPQRDPFDLHFPSHLTGHHKPSPAAYQRVLAAFSDAECTFFDDRAANVEAASRAGMRAYLVSGPDELASRLSEIGVLDGGINGK